MAAIVVNPAARKASEKKIALARALLYNAGYETKLYNTERKGHGIELAAIALREGASLVIAAGGDGTYNECMNTLAGTEVPMGILPMGTTNVLAKELGIPENLKGAIVKILNSSPRQVYPGRLRFGPEDNPDKSATRRFFLMAGVGFDADAVYNVNKKMKVYSGKAAYLWSGVKRLINWRPEPIPVIVDGKEFRASSLIVCKGAKYGGHLKAAPHACVTDPWLYALLMTGFGRGHVLKYTGGLLTGTHMKFKDVHYLKCNSIRVEGQSHVQADGDYIGKAPLTIDVSPETVKVFF
jgi:diacylglycerol kinase (ATP)